MAKKKMIPEADWKWFGLAGHFICGRWCRFHLCTQVGDFLVSTVGMYVHPMNGKGHERAEAEWLAKNPNGAEIGYQRFYETMVFKAGKPCTADGCGCGQPGLDSGELDGDGYNDVKAATIGHRMMCLKVAMGNVKVEA
jgi:hypothetical protein